jgi:hypothetical protein
MRAPNAGMNSCLSNMDSHAVFLLPNRLTLLESEAGTTGQES